MKTHKLLILFFLVSIHLSCHKDEITQVKDNDYLIFGNFFKDCEGEKCVETFLLTDGKMYEDLSDSYTKSKRFNFVELSSEMFAKNKDLFDAFPKKILNERISVFGCPDCAGQGGLYIAYKKNGELKSWRIDNDKTQIPTYLYDFVDRVNDKLSHLNK